MKYINRLASHVLLKYNCLNTKSSEEGVVQMNLTVYARMILKLSNKVGPIEPSLRLEKAGGDDGCESATR